MTDAMRSMTAFASRSEKNFCLEILSKSSPPRMRSNTRKTLSLLSKRSLKVMMCGC